MKRWLGLIFFDLRMVTLRIQEKSSLIIWSKHTFCYFPRFMVHGTILPRDTGQRRRWAMTPSPPHDDEGEQVRIHSTLRIWAVRFRRLCTLNALLTYSICNLWWVLLGYNLSLNQGNTQYNWIKFSVSVLDNQNEEKDILKSEIKYL